MKTLFPLIIIVLCTLTGCPSVDQRDDTLLANNKAYTVKMKPDLVNNKLEITSEPQGGGNWGSNRKKGWVGFGKGHYGIITFFLESETPGAQCQSTDHTGPATWVITQIALSDTGDTTSDKGTNFGNKQEDWLVDAFPGTDQGTGVRYPLTPSTVPTTSVRIFDSNDNKDPKIAYYKVTASKCKDGNPDPTQTLTADPGIGNTGN